MKRVLAVIPARSGSKRLPGKNIRNILGKPMIGWTIEAALKSKIFTDVIVSTDGEDIAEISKKFGAEVPFLRSEIDANDYTPVSVATKNSLIRMQELNGKKYDYIVQLMPNCPCRTEKDIIDSFDFFRKSGTNFQISVFKFGWMNPWWALKLEDKSMHPKPLFPYALKMRSQDLEALFCPTGSIWIAKAEKLIEEGTFYGSGYIVFPLPWQSSIDIDDEEDFEMAEAVISLMYNKIKGPKPEMQVEETIEKNT